MNARRSGLTFRDATPEDMAALASLQERFLSLTGLHLVMTPKPGDRQCACGRWFYPQRKTSQCCSEECQKKRKRSGKSNDPERFKRWYEAKKDDPAWIAKRRQNRNRDKI